MCCRTSSACWPSVLSREILYPLGIWVCDAAGRGLASFSFHLFYFILIFRGGRGVGIGMLGVRAHTVLWLLRNLGISCSGEWGGSVTSWGMKFIC